MVKYLPEFEYFTVFLKKRNFIDKIERSKVTDYAALSTKPLPNANFNTILTHKTIKDMNESFRVVTIRAHFESNYSSYHSNYSLIRTSIVAPKVL